MFGRTEQDFHEGIKVGFKQAQYLSYEELQRGVQHAEAIDETGDIPDDAYALLEDRYVQIRSPYKVQEEYSLKDARRNCRRQRARSPGFSRSRSGRKRAGSRGVQGTS